MTAVIDASVALKWFLPSPNGPDVDAAVRLLSSLREGDIEALQPPHWRIEVAAVLTRLRPEIAERAVALLAAMELSVVDEVRTLERAVRLGRTLGHHVFDTLYHALAIERAVTLITADERYYRRAKGRGHILLLADWGRRTA